MELQRHLVLLAVASMAVLLCACFTSAVPVPGRHQGDFSELADLLGRIKGLEGSKDTPDNAWALVSKEQEDEEGIPLSTRSAASSKSSTLDKLTALRQGFLGFNKRQGSWSYDYGLGGGRFGKRYYGDYGIGGGRFGRDVDHVDVAETGDATL